MSQVDIVVPSVGESIVEANIGQLFFNSGDWVEKDAAVLELETDKATVEVNAPESGRLILTVQSGDTVAIGSPVGKIDTEATKPDGRAVPAEAPSGPPVIPVGPPPVPEKTTKQAQPQQNIIQQSSAPNIASSALKGLGPAKRKAIREGKESLPKAPLDQKQIAFNPTEGQQRKKRSVMRKKIAERLLQSQHSTATLTTFNEINMAHVLELREKLKDQFMQKHGVKLGFMSFFTKAACFALDQVPAVNAFIEGDDAVYNSNVHMSIAVSTERGLVVPVVRNSQKLSFAQIESEIALLAEKSRAGKLGIDEMMGGTFTITNGGVFGSLISTPILNPPQSAILGLHKTEHRPIAVPNNSGGFTIEVQPMMYVALSYDHRMVDGKESVTFLVKVKEYLESIVTEGDIL